MNNVNYMNYTQSVEYIHSFTRFGSQLGLARMRKLLTLIDNPQDKLKFIHVAGTNGKGSTVKMCAEILENAGYRVGVYISPFVLDFRERFQIRDTMIPKSIFSRLASRMAPLVEQLAKEGDQITEFEIITAIAFQYFYESKCSIVCLEVGLGGKFDATNVINSPLVAIIASISLDHTEILGDTIAKIAGEKAGIIKENTIAVTYPLQHPDAVSVLMEKCAATNSTLILPNAKNVLIKSCDITGSDFTYGGHRYSIRFVGEHQIYNAVAVIEAMYVLRQKGFCIDDFNIEKGLRHAKSPARFEIMNKSPLIVLDGGHNAQAAMSLSKSISMIKKSPKIAIMGMMADKDYHTALSYILKECTALITIPVANPRAISPNLLAKSAEEFISEIYVEEDYDKALERAISLCKDDGAVIVCGSFYMASDMRKNIIKWKKLRNTAEKPL